MKVNYILIILFLFILFIPFWKKTPLESLKNNDFSEVGEGCCNFDGSSPIPIEANDKTDCLKKCKDTKNCLAVDIGLDPFTCNLYQDESFQGTIDTVKGPNCNKCYRITETNNSQCPYKFILKENPPYSYDTEILIDDNKKELSLLDKITNSLKQIIKLESKPSGCNANDPKTCRPGALTSSELVRWLETEEKILNNTCHEADADDNCSKTENNIAKKLPEDDIPVESRIQEVETISSEDTITHIHGDNEMPIPLSHTHDKPTFGSAQQPNQLITHTHLPNEPPKPSLFSHNSKSLHEPLFDSLKID